MSMNAFCALMLAATTAAPIATNQPPAGASATNGPIARAVQAARAASQAVTNGQETVEDLLPVVPVVKTTGSVTNTPSAGTVKAPTSETNDVAKASVPAVPAVQTAPVPASAVTPTGATTNVPPGSAVAKMGETDEIKVPGLGAAELETKENVKVVEGPTPTSVRLADPNAVTLDENTRVDITCEDATIADILRQFRKTVGANIISVDSTNLSRRISVRLNNAPWLPSLESILSTRGFRLEPRDGAYFVAETHQAAVPLFTRSYKLKHASAEELAELFNQSYGTVSPDGKVKKKVAIAYPSANVVIVTGEQKVLSDCESIIEVVDEAVSQIYIEARFIELSTEALHKLGVQWNQLESWGASASSLKAGFERNDGRLARYYQDKTTTMYSPENAGGRSAVDYVTRNYATGSITEAPGAGRTADDMSWFNARGFSGQLSADDFRIAMSAFEQMSDVKVFSNPKVVVSNGKEAKVDMTTKFPNVRVQATRNTSNGSDSFDISTQLEVIPGEDKLMFAKESFYSWGITLTVRPRVAPDGIINVEIIPTISQLDNTAITEYTGFYKVSGGDSSAYSSYPVIDVKRISTDFTMKDGSTAVIGGLSKTTEEDMDSGIPYLRQIPWVGQKLFGWKSRQKVQKEIVVFVTLGIANPEKMKTDVGLPKNAILGRQYVDGRQFEPGDRSNAIESVTTLNAKDLESRFQDQKKAEDAQPVKAAPESAPTAAPVANEVPPAKPVAQTPFARSSRPTPNVQQPPAPAPAQPVEPKVAPAPQPVPQKPAARKVEQKKFLSAPAPEPEKKVSAMKPLLAAPARTQPVEKKTVPAVTSERQPTLQDLLQQR